jgi:hypothetical protein
MSSRAARIYRFTISVSEKGPLELEQKRFCMQMIRADEKGAIGTIWHVPLFEDGQFCSLQG